MLRILIPTDEPNFSLGLVEGYRGLGLEVVCGAKYFTDRVGDYDLIHLQWPEEYSGWRVPDDEKLKKIEELLKYWRKRAFLINTVHNLRPHSSQTSSAKLQNAKLYSLFFENCHLITHFTHESAKLVRSEYPVAVNVGHLVHTPPSYEVTLKRQKSRGGRRLELGLSPKEFVILMLGRLRSTDEMDLLISAFNSAKVPNKRLLMAGKIVLKKNWKNYLYLKKWKYWLWQVGAIVDERYYPEEEIAKFLDSSDVLVVPRIGEMHSGIVFLGMTFGKLIVAPDCGGNPECLIGSRNLIYKTGNASSLASCLSSAATLDLEAIGRENSTIAEGWSWSGICTSCLSEALHIRSRPSPRDRD